MDKSIDRPTFEGKYAGRPPWDTGRPQPAFVAVAERIVSPVLDAGCGTGENALFLAAQGHRVTGIDFVPEAIRRARHKAAERNLQVEFQVGDALTWDGAGERIASVIDSGLFHVFSDDDRRRYVAALGRIVEFGGRLFLMCFSDAEPGTDGPRRISRRELDLAFADGWEIESVQPVRFEVAVDVTDVSFSEGGPKAWFAVIRRTQSVVPDGNRGGT